MPPAVLSLQARQVIRLHEDQRDAYGGVPGLLGVSVFLPIPKLGGLA